MAIDVRKAVRIARKMRRRKGKNHGPHLSTGSAMLVGAGLVTAGRLVLSSRDGLVDSVQQKLAGLVDEQPADEEFDEPDFEDEPEAYEDDDEDFDEDEDEAEEPRAPRRRSRRRARAR